MSYEIEVVPSARREIGIALAWYTERTEHATRWLKGLEEALGSLSENPARCPVSREGALLGREVRELLYRTWRVFFEIRGNRVAVLHLRHTARGPLDP